MRVEYRFRGEVNRTFLLSGVVKVTRVADDFGNLGAWWECERKNGVVTVLDERLLVAVLPDEED